MLAMLLETIVVNTSFLPLYDLFEIIKEIMKILLVKSGYEHFRDAETA